MSTESKNEQNQFLSQETPETLAVIHFAKQHKTFEDLRKALYALGIKSSFDQNRVIFNTLHSSKAEITNIYQQECNGLVLSKDTTLNSKEEWKILCVPPRSLRFNIDTNQSDIYLHQGLYHIFKVQDGTCVNLYYYQNRWVIATASGYEMNNIKWESQTYQELFTECLEHLETPLTWEEFTEKLDVQHCYSFGFKHPKFHRFRERQVDSLYRLWFIQCVNLDPTNENYLWASDNGINGIPVQSRYEESVNNLTDLYKLASNALLNYIEYGEPPCFGFILRSVNFEKTGFHSDLFIESTLMRSIRKTWYENSMIELCHKKNWQSHKETIITLHSYLDSERYEVFQLLFPQYQDQCDLYANDIRQIIDQMILSDNIKDGKYSNIAQTFLVNFNKSIKYDVSKKSADQKRKIYFSWILSPVNLETLATLYIS